MKCVYKIVCKDKEITEFYMGSSVNFNDRKRTHKSYSNNLNHRQYCIPLYMFINVNGGWKNWEMIVIEEFPNHSKKELNIEEQKYMDLLKPNLNDKNANGLDVERIKNTQKINNKIHSKIYSNKTNCPQCGKEMRKDSINKHIKKWCKNNIV